VTRVTGVLGEDVEADPLQRGRVLGEPAAGAGALVETVREQRLPGTPADGAQLGREVLCRLVVGDAPRRRDATGTGVYGVRAIRPTR
jgi:hypothetical protein